MDANYNMSRQLYNTSISAPFDKLRVRSGFSLGYRSGTELGMTFVYFFITLIVPTTTLSVLMLKK
jgi:hypothetical protein